MKGVFHLRSLGWMTAALWLLAPALQGEDEPPLPTWDVAPSSPGAPGGNFSQLLPERQEPGSDDPFYLGNPMLKPQPLLSDDATLNPHDLSLFLRGGLLAVPQEPVQQAPTPVLALKDLPEHVLSSLSQVPLNEHLIDPQSLVTEVPALDLARLLEFHAEESRILLYILVIERDEKLGNISQIRALTERLTGKRDLCLAVYPLGEPWRVRLLVSPRVQQHTPVSALMEMGEDCIADALLTHDAERQLQRFAVKLSTRLFQLEKSLPPEVAPQVAAVSSGLHEVARKGGAPEILPVAVREASVWTIILISSLTVLALALTAYGIKIWKRYRRARKSHHVWMLPENEVRPRLGGAFSGGAGRMMSCGPKTGAL